MPNEEKIVAECIDGKLDGFEGLYAAYIEAIYRFVYYRVSEREVAEDITSDVFLKALSGIKGLKQPGRFRPWLYGIARNRVIDHYRSRKDTTPLGDMHFEMTDPQDLEEEAERELMLSQVKSALVDLSDTERDVVIMRVWDELSYKEIAEIIGKTEGNCKVIFSRAVTGLKKSIPISTFIFLVINGV